MILKYFELEKLNFEITNFLLFHGKNEGYKGEEIKKITNKFNIKVKNYEEKQVIDNTEEFFANNLNKSFFENDKVIIINRCTDKIIKIVEELIDRNINDIIFILISEILDKKSKLRNFFEKEKDLVSIAFYSDNNETLSTITKTFFSKKNIPISQESINLIVNRANGDRKSLNNELSKIENYLTKKKKITIEEIYILTNLSENYSINELVDNCLAKNKDKILYIINENNFSFEDTIIIIRTFLAKAKRLIKLNQNMQIHKSIDQTIINFRPPIFWKDKELVKKQIKIWTLDKTYKLIDEINKIELNVKKNSINSLKILFDFILATSKTNN